VEREEHALKSLASKELVKTRYELICANPSEINQDQFGICGMTSIVYLLLLQHRSRADELYKATFGDVLGADGSDKFTTATGAQVRISLRYLCRKYQRFVDEYVFSKNEEAKVKKALYDPKANTALFVDYCLSRALGYVLWKVDPNRYLCEKLQFNLEFSPVGVIQDWSRVGNLALRTNNLAYMAVHIVGAAEVTILRNKRGRALESHFSAASPPTINTTEREFTTADELIDECKVLSPKQYALAAIFAELVGATPNTNVKLGYDHWIVIQEIRAKSPTEVEMTYWTWGKSRKGTKKKDQLIRCVQDLIIVKWI
jgi:hypothetical protein